MLFKNETESLKIEVVNYEFQHAQGEDANWLVLKGTYTCDGDVVIDRCSCLTADELREMNAGLKVLATGIRDEYASEFCEPYFEVTVIRVGEDDYRAGISFTMLNALEDCDTVDIEISCNKADIQGWIDYLEKAEKKFPPRD